MQSHHKILQSTCLVKCPPSGAGHDCGKARGRGGFSLGVSVFVQRALSTQGCAVSTHKWEKNKGGEPAKDDSTSAAGLNYLALIGLHSPAPEVQSARLRLTPGMQVSAEILLGTRTVFEY